MWLKSLLKTIDINYLIEMSKDSNTRVERNNKRRENKMQLTSIILAFLGIVFAGAGFGGGITLAIEYGTELVSAVIFLFVLGFIGIFSLMYSFAEYFKN